ncbi:class I SAM-dependent methyltransferase [Roseibium alexandrii]|uniref:Methyltransferase domain protein n=1 Tax=Roseibium alexandrii (strain DSM 17067 / NCIMB 14079 / DFL-11) TaxID=244592 RepID=A0A5E8GUB2_ROSAD|nr:methyltransferase domain-containing protein [Roseibium alexandrii]EEE42918.1 Methyltransferase domain protein [Roseibium alexandrii DFL-11]
MQSVANTTYSGLQELAFVEESMPEYNEHIVKLISGALRDCEAIVDFGAGIGTLADVVHKQTAVRPRCIEIDESAQSILRHRGYQVSNSLLDLPVQVGGIYSSNVLEHIEDDRGAIRDCFEALQPGGTLVLYLPAFQLLFSGLDRSVGHYRRYSKRDLIHKLQTSGFNIKDCHYVESLGFFASLVVKLVGYDVEGGLGSASSYEFYNKYVFPLSKKIDAVGARHLLGKNIFVVAQKPHAA